MYVCMYVCMYVPYVCIRAAMNNSFFVSGYLLS